MSWWESAMVAGAAGFGGGIGVVVGIGIVRMLRRYARESDAGQQ